MDRALPRARNAARRVRGLDLARDLRARARSNLQAGLAERRPRRTDTADRQLLHQRARGREHIDHRRARPRRRGQCVPQRLPAPRQQAGVERRSARRDTRHLSAIRLQVPRLALRPRRQPVLRATRGRVLRPRQELSRTGARALRRVGRLHLRQPCARARTIAARVSRPDDHRARGISVRTDDGAIRVSHGRARELEALHGRVRGVLPRTGPAREAVTGALRGRRREVRLRSAALSHRSTTPARQHVGCAQLGDGRRRGQAVGSPDARRIVRPVGQARPRRDAARPEPRALQTVGTRLVPAVPELRHPDLEPGLVPHVQLLADVVQHAHLRGERVLPARADGTGTRRARDDGRDVQGVRAAGRQHARSDAGVVGNAGGRSLSSQRPGSAVAPPAQGRRRLGRRLPARAARARA